MSQTIVYLWFGITAFIGLVVVITQKARKQSLPASEQFVVMALAVGSTIAFGQVLYKIFVLETLRDLLGSDGTIALCIGSCFGIYLSIKEIWKLF